MPQPRNRRRGAGQGALAALLVTDDTPEAELQKVIIREAVANGWTVMHVLRSKVGGHGGQPPRWVTNTAIHTPDPELGRMNKGWPDLTMIHPTGRLLFVEVKGPQGRPTPEQKFIIRLLQAVASVSAGRVKAYVVGPKDWPALAQLIQQASAAEAGNMVATPTEGPPQ